MATNDAASSRSSSAAGRDSQPIAEPGRIAVADMEELIAAGEAQPLLEEFDVGPAFYQGVWWAIPHGEWDRGYAAAPEAFQHEWSATFLRLERAACRRQLKTEQGVAGPSTDQFSSAVDTAQIVAVGQYADALRARVQQPLTTRICESCGVRTSARTPRPPLPRGDLGGVAA